MKSSIINIKSLTITTLYGVVLETISYLVVSGVVSDYMSNSRIITYGAIAISFLLGAIYFIFHTRTHRFFQRIANMAIPIGLSVSSLLFLFVTSIGLVHQFIIIIASLLLALFLISREDKDIAYRFINLSIFFILLVFFFDIYSLLYLVSINYWQAMLLIVSLPLLLLYYMLMSAKVHAGHCALYVSLLAIIIEEFFLASLFWPLASMLLKSFSLVAVYYAYWGMVDIYAKKLLRRRDSINYAVIFSLLVVIIFISMFIRR